MLSHESVRTLMQTPAGNSVPTIVQTTAAGIMAVTAVAQAVLAFVLWRATTKYVELTARLVDMNAAQLEQLRGGAVAERNARLVRVRQLADQLKTAIASLPARLDGGGVDASMRTTAMWKQSEPDELARRIADAMPTAQHHAREVTNNIGWIADRVADVRATTREQGFRYERINLEEWHRRREAVLTALNAIETAAIAAEMRTNAVAVRD